MVDASKSYPKNGKNSTSSTGRPTKRGVRVKLSPEQALEIFQSALAYLTEAGIEVQAGQKNGDLVLAFVGLSLDITTKTPRIILKSVSE